MKIWHDPGHGGKDPGCIDNGITESKWVYDFTHTLMGALDPLCHEQAVSRKDDQDPTLEDRAELASQFGADIAFLHHVNASGDVSIDGLMTFALSNNAMSCDVAGAIVRAAPFGLLRKSRECTLVTPEAWPRVMSCLKHYADRSIPAVLVEYGFATSFHDAMVLQCAASRPALCACIYSGVARAIEIKNGGYTK